MDPEDNDLRTALKGELGKLADTQNSLNTNDDIFDGSLRTRLGKVISQWILALRGRFRHRRD
jgi:hypothetical protein